MALYHYLKNFNTKKLLIIAPANKIAEGGWQRTIAGFSKINEYSLLTYNMLPKKFSEFNDYFVIFDECHRIKNSTGVWGKAAYKLTLASAGFVLLSATPMPNGWEDSINYFKMFNLTKNKTSFIKENAITTKINGYLEILGWKNETKLKNMWNNISKRLSKSEANDLPDLVFIDVNFKPSITYKKIKKDRIYKDIVYDNQMKLRHGLRLHANLQDKLDYLKNFINDTTDNIIVFYNYNEELDQLKSVIDKKTFFCNSDIKNFPLKDQWENVKNTVTLANYKSGSEAVEFTYANIIIYFSPSESYLEFYQSYGRCHRTGQKSKVTAYKYTTLNSIETDIYTALNNKQDFNFNLWQQEIGGLK